jgi:hypothetical protein
LSSSGRSFLAIRRAQRRSAFGTDPNGSYWRVSDSANGCGAHSGPALPNFRDGWVTVLSATAEQCPLRLQVPDIAAEMISASAYDGTSPCADVRSPLGSGSADPPSASSGPRPTRRGRPLRWLPEFRGGRGVPLPPSVNLSVPFSLCSVAERHVEAWLAYRRRTRSATFQTARLTESGVERNGRSNGW